MNFTPFDVSCMASALRLARRGLNTTHPNPRVGCIIARHGKRVASGWHQRAGEAHAEINALRAAGEKAAGATVYVTLEPCCHSGRTSPCVEALVKAKIVRLVSTHEDTNPEVAGNGFEYLRQAGIEVQTGLLSEQAQALNAGFLQRMRQQRPWVRIKLAQSMDGHIALANGSSQWISGAPARADVQAWRARSDAILTGIGTVLADDPALNVRLNKDSRQPLRVIVDSHWRLSKDARLLHLGGKVLIAGINSNAAKHQLSSERLECIELPVTDGRVDLKALMRELASRGINEVQVEAGATLCGALLEQRLVDEILIYQAPVLLGGGAVSPFATPRLNNMLNRIHLKWLDSRQIGNDLCLRLQPVY